MDFILLINKLSSLVYGITTVSIACTTPLEAFTSAITTVDLFPLLSVSITLAPLNVAVKIPP